MASWLSQRVHLHFALLTSYISSDWAPCQFTTQLNLLVLPFLFKGIIEIFSITLSLWRFSLLWLFPLIYCQINLFIYCQIVLARHYLPVRDPWSFLPHEGRPWVVFLSVTWWSSGWACGTIHTTDGAWGLRYLLRRNFSAIQSYSRVRHKIIGLLFSPSVCPSRHKFIQSLLFRV
jgi:hypothetical protein